MTVDKRVPVFRCLSLAACTIQCRKHLHLVNAPLVPHTLFPTWWWWSGSDLLAIAGLKRPRLPHQCRCSMGCLAKMLDAVADDGFKLPEASIPCPP